jgi:hypothetical protein
MIGFKMFQFILRSKVEQGKICHETICTIMMYNKQTPLAFAFWVCCMWTLGQSVDCRDPPSNPARSMPAGNPMVLQMHAWFPQKIITNL